MNFKKTKTIIILVVVFSTLFVFAYGTTPSISAATAQFKYPLLESFPGFFKQGSTDTDLPKLILAIYKFGIWTVGIAGLFMLTIGGFMYMASAGNNATVTSAKKIITDSLLGIVAALAAYLIMYVINPDLTNINIAFTTASVDKQQEYTGGTTETDKGNETTSGGCIKVVDAARGQESWIYNQSLRGQTVNGIRYTDCSEFISSAYTKVGCKSPGSTTSGMYPNAKNFNNAGELKAGDAIVKLDSNGGHVVLCMDDGCTQIIHSPGSSHPVVTIKDGSAAANKQPTFWSTAKVLRASDYCGSC